MLLLDIFLKLLLPHIRVFYWKYSICVCKYWETSKFEKQNKWTSLKKRGQSFLKNCFFRTWAAQQFLLCDIYNQILKNILLYYIIIYYYFQWGVCVFVKEVLTEWSQAQTEMNNDIKNSFCLITSSQTFPRECDKFPTTHES